MRRLFAVLGLVASISGASAQQYELPTLRGSSSFVPDAPGPLYRPRWSGFYAGGQVGYGVASLDFASSTRELVAFMLRELALESVAQVSTWEVLGKLDNGAASYGGFLGYNIGWEGVVVGFEFNYSRSNFYKEAPFTPISRVTSANGNIYDVTVTGGASMRITDVATLRARAGFEYGNFLPYAMIGVAAARADLNRFATVAGEQNPTTPPPCDPLAVPLPCVPFSFSGAESKNGAFLFGWMLGGGLELMMMPKVFLRGEYEYVAFSPVWGIKTGIQTARAGIGYKF